VENTTQGRAPANAGEIISVNKTELHSVMEAAEKTMDALENDLPRVQRALDNADPSNLGLIQQMAEVRNSLVETRGIVEQVQAELRAVDSNTDRDDKVWRAVEDMRNPNGFHSRTYRELGEVFKASYKAHREHGYTREVEGYDRPIDIARRAADQSSTDDTLGGILVPVETWGDVAYIMGEKSFLRAFASRTNMASDEIKVPMLPSIPSVYVQGTQGSEVTHSVMTFRDTVTMSAKTLIGLNVIPNQLVQDAIGSWSAFWARVFTDAMALKENKGYFSESPADANGAFSGVLQEVAAATGSEKNVVYLGGGSTSGSTHFSVVAFDDINALLFANHENARDGSIFACSNAVARHLYGIKDANRMPIYSTQWAGLNVPGGPTPNSAGPVYGQLMNHRLCVTSAMPSTNATGSPFLVFTNPAYTFWGERSPMAIEFSRESQFELYNTVMRVAERIGIKTVAPDASATLNAAVS